MKRQGAPTVDLQAIARAEQAARWPLRTDTPRSRATDPQSSHEAADAIKATGVLHTQQERVLALVNVYPGRTCWELAEIYARESGQSVESCERWIGRRLGELAPVHITRSEAMAKVVRGRKACTWWPR